MPHTPFCIRSAFRSQSKSKGKKDPDVYIRDNQSTSTLARESNTSQVITSIEEFDHDADGVEANSLPHTYSEASLSTLSGGIVTGPTSPSVKTEQDAFQAFAHRLPFTLKFCTANNPPKDTNEGCPLPTMLTSFTPLPGIPAIPAELEISFTQIMDTACFIDTIDGILLSNGHRISHYGVKNVVVSFTHKNGRRQRHTLRLENVNLLTRPWAKEVWRRYLDAAPTNCTCEECITGDRKDARAGHGLVVEVVFPQGLERVWKGAKDTPHQDEPVETWGGREKIQSRGRSPVALSYAHIADDTKRVRFKK